ncbi:hypothetical protein [Streptomyces sp. A1-5]|uniref:hypothetical protein n=1 Tax=Streptomyces sp. A1-5 TaxID=2738410 RepID=UPI001F1881CC|nr:hypothetical protein [Streptomyces sp. A1-5]UJB44287.1 hypothetical protein HRD51_28875 [Streptomyces sp. A1-5]
MSFALAGCGTGVKSTESILPPRESMPTELRTVTSKPSTAALARKKCSSTSDMPSGWCKSAVAQGHVVYGSGDESKRAVFDLVAYGSDKAARDAFRKWTPPYHPSRLRNLNAEKFGSESVAFVGVEGAARGDQQVVVHEGHYVGTVHYLGSGKQDALDPTLSKLSKMFADRMKQEG